ncbi:MAG TPA: acylphosphatase [Aestuariivirga sp.]|nr:acylphosphatase [Aestuariivirga sp.]
MNAVRVIVEGRVQGVGYRAFVVDEAAARGLTGWVRNLRDGSVEMVLNGGEADIENMIAACRKGPRFASVTSVRSSLAPDEGWPDFTVRPAP